jgi:hypothetical protein
MVVQVQVNIILLIFKTISPIQKHFVIINKRQIPIMDLCRVNLQLFKHIKRIPKSEQIGTVLRSQSFNRADSATEVIYK